MKEGNLEAAVADVVEVLQFEQWMRFYFLVEEGEKLRLEVPESMAARVEEKSSHLAGLLQQMNHGLIDPQKSQEAVCGFVGENIEGVKHSPYLVPAVFDSKQFKLEMYLFNLWLKAYEEGFDTEQDKGFDEWRELYAAWRATDQVKQYVRELESAPAPAVGDPCSRTVQ
ncbi:MAG: hypothetical protein PWQ57_1256 [Desulfovibrionales bacterium]|nr:hypothetical protein [Desulfovibrionales bacterium]